MTLSAIEGGSSDELALGEPDGAAVQCAAMSRRTLALLTLVTALTVLISPMTRDLFVGDETKYGQVIREMRGGHWLVPHLNGNPYSHKPPLHFWVIGGATLVAGTDSILPFVFQSLLAYAGTLLLVLHIGRRLYGESAGLIAALVWATFLLSWGTAQTARMDPAYVFLLTLAIWLVWLYLEGQAGGRALLGAGAAIGTAILIKGPMALVMIGTLLLLERIRRGKLRGGAGWAGSFALAAIIPLVWLVPALLAGGADYADELLVKQNVGRAIGSWVHRAPFWFYVPRFPATYFPWFAAVLFAIVAIWKRPLDPADRSARSFLFRWILAVVIPFSLLSGKLDIYMLPALVPAAILTGAFLADSRLDWMDRWTIRINRIVMAVLVIVGAIVPLAAPAALDGKPEAPFAADPRVIGLFAVMAIAAAAALAASFAPRLRSALATSVLLALAVVAPLIWLAGPLMPLVNEESSGVRLVRALEKQGVAGDEIGLIRSPHLWTRGMDPALESARHLDAHELIEASSDLRPRVLVTRRDRQDEVQSVLHEYERVDSVRMIGKEFDVWRRP